MVQLFWLAATALVSRAIAQETITITIVASNAGNGAATQQVNAPMMAPGTLHQINVGGGTNVFDPPSITAAMGDMLQFNFLAKNHTVTQSTFDQPCVKMEGGVDSGFMPNPNGTMDPPPRMMFQVMTQEPIWMYCRQANHCGGGMGFSINPTAEKSQDAFITKAKEQNGTAGAVAPPPPPPPPVAAASGTAPPPAAASIATGQGTLGSGGACSCSCACGQGGFPAANQGNGMQGGFAGSIPAASIVGAMSPAPPAKRHAVPLAKRHAARVLS